MINEHRLEYAARELCRLRGVDPNASVGHPAAPDANGFIPAIMLYSPAWRLAANEIAAALHMRAALAAYDTEQRQADDDDIRRG